MVDAADIDVLLSLDGLTYEAAEGYVIEIRAERTYVTSERPHGLSYALIFRAEDGRPYIRFDNAHAVRRPGGRFVKAAQAYDHWHRSENDKGRPYVFTTALKLLEDFQAEVKRVLDEKGIANDL